MGRPVLYRSRSSADTTVARSSKADRPRRIARSGQRYLGCRTRPAFTGSADDYQSRRRATTRDGLATTNRRFTPMNAPSGEPTRGTSGASNHDPGEIARFDEIAQRWWDPAGEFRPLHVLNPVRLGYVDRKTN